MKILHLNTHDIMGGAAIAAHRLHRALNKEQNVQSLMGVWQKNSDEKEVLPLINSSIRHKIRTRLCDKLVSLHKPNKDIVFTSHLLPSRLTSTIASTKPDIIHLHWIAQFISPYVLKHIATLNIPIVWTLHDTWAFTGGCHFGKCEKWKDECRKCPVLNRSFGFDLSHYQWKLKKETYKKIQPTIICPSKEMTRKANCSLLLKDYTIHTIPNLLDTSSFYPIGKKLARNLLKLDQDKKYILFGAMSATNDHNKGYDLLLNALHHLKAQNINAHALIFGASHGDALPIPSTFLGHLHDEISLALIYSASDVFVCPSREENLPNTIMESLACGTPVVGFEIGGIPDMVEHKINGYIATPYDTRDLAKGITFILEDSARHKQMDLKACKVVEERYASHVVAKQYIDLYNEILTKHAK